jgi:hypothetical protein
MPKRLIVIHTAECGETLKADTSVAAYLRSRNLPVHYVVDADSHVKMLELADRCGAARGLPSRDGVHIEHAGTAHQTPAQWADDYSVKMLHISAMLAAHAASELGIPVRHVRGQAVRTGSGFCGHIDVTNAYGVRGGHWDPGPSFPWEWYLDLVRTYQALAAGAVNFTDEKTALARWVAGVRARAAELLPFVQGMPNLNGSTPYSWHTIRLQQTLNLVADAQLKEDGLYGRATGLAVWAWQKSVNAKRPGSIKDFPGACHESTRWFLALQLLDLTGRK